MSDIDEIFELFIKAFEPKKKTRYTSKWRPFSELRLVQSDISCLGYNKKYIEEHGLSEMESFYGGNMITGVECYYEPFEVKTEGNEILWRHNENYIFEGAPEKFETQLGTFNNHNHGEFESWLNRDDFYIDGNFSDMFDCGEYSYAISSLMHRGCGTFKIIRIDKNLEALTMYKNYDGIGYIGRFRNSEGYAIIASGSKVTRRKEITILLQIDRSGNCTINQEWNFWLSSVNSIVVSGNYAFFGQNKMITRLDVKTGDINYFTNKTDKEVASLEPVF